MYSAGFNKYIEFASGRLLLSRMDAMPLLDAKEPVRNGIALHERNIPERQNQDNPVRAGMQLQLSD